MASAQPDRSSTAWAAVQGRLVFEMANATVRVVGDDIDSVRVVARGRSTPWRNLRPPHVAGSTIRFAQNENTQPVVIEVRVPRYFDVELRGSNGGSYVVDSVDGNIDIENSNAGVRVNGARRSVLVTTSNGPIVLESIEVPASAAISLITSNDSVSVTLPRSVNADLLLETDNGSVLSEFATANGMASGPPDKAVRALRTTIGRGGATLRVRTDNGMIWIRQE